MGNFLGLTLTVTVVFLLSLMLSERDRGKDIKRIMGVATAGLWLMYLAAAPARAMPNLEHCNIVSGMAESIMEARQRGVNLSQIIQLINESSNEPLKPLQKAIAMAAYKSNRYSMEENQVDEVKRFKELVLLTCLDGEL